MARVRFSPVPPTKRSCRRRLVARIADLQSADEFNSPRRRHVSRSSNGSGQNATNVQIRVRVPSGIPSCEVVAERQRHLTVYEDQVGSTPIHFAKRSTM